MAGVQGVQRRGIRKTGEIQKGRRAATAEGRLRKGGGLIGQSEALPGPDIIHGSAVVVGVGLGFAKK